MANTYDVLCSKKFHPEKGREMRFDLSVKEKGVSYVLKLKEKSYTSVFQVDGNIICEGNKCDKLVVVEFPDNEGWANVFVELKGSDVKHAIIQLETTLCHPIFCNEHPQKIYARIVSSSMPMRRNDPEWEKAQIRFQKKYRCELKRVKSQQPDSLK